MAPFGAALAESGVAAATGAAAGVGATAVGFFAAVERALGAFVGAAAALDVDGFAELAAAGFFAGVRVLLCGFLVSVTVAGVVSTFFAEARDRPCVEPLGFLSLGFVMVTAPGCSRGVEEERRPL